MCRTGKVRLRRFLRNSSNCWRKNLPRQHWSLRGISMAKLSIYKYIRTAKGWRYCKAAFYPNGKIRPNVVIVSGVEEKHTEGRYFLNFNNQWIYVGLDALGAQRRRLLRLNQMEYARLSGRSQAAALRATESISRVLSGFLPAVGRAISDEEFRWQQGERIAVLDIVENRLTRPTTTALVRQIRSVVRRSRPQTRDNPVADKIGSILSSIPQTDDLLMFDAFSTGEWELDVEHADLQEADKARQKLLSQGVAAFRVKFPSGQEQVDGLVQMVKDAEACGIDIGNKPYNF